MQGAGRDPLRPFGGHAVRTVAWDRFDPSTLGSDVDTVVASAPDPAAALELVSALRAAGDDRAVLLVPDDSPGWREVADLRLPRAGVVLGGLAGLPDYLAEPDPARPGSPGGDGRARNVIQLPRVPRGSGRQDIYARLKGHGPTVASAMRSWALDVAGEGADAAPAPPAPRPPEPAPVFGPAVPGPAPGEIRLPDTPVLAPLPPPAPPTTREAWPLPASPRRPEEDPPATGLPAEPARALPSPPAARDPDAPSRRLARAMADPAVLVPAALAQVERLVDAARTPGALAGFLLDHVGADAVEILAPDDTGWRTEATVGDCPGAGTVPEVVDVPGLVAWLESSFDAPVVLDGSDLGAEGSWVLAAPAREAGGTVALLLAWRRPGRTIFDPVAVSAVAEAVDDAAPSLALAAAVRRLARALAVVTD
ncbi:MAG: hypothetical protein ACFCVG_17555 [Kineosporiaceae bacterium]